ncbi:MAG TPA: helix-turn-helix transcriptional regulator [Candidatus Fimenecus excrementavium]|nr:helix-turn-helix transcriptional regulator [Candidatus Fimenecus excrementavium]
MSDFSNKCRAHIEHAGTNVYQLAKISGLDRTSLQRMVSGKRLPGKDFVKRLLPYLRLNIQQQEELLELYEAESLGKTVYYNRLYIKGILEHLSFRRYPGDLYTSCAPASFDTIQAVSHFLKEALLSEKEPACLCTNLPATHISFFQALLYLRAKYQCSFALRHLFRMVRTPEASDNANANLEILNCVLGFSCTGCNYSPSYFYTSDTLSESSTVLFPYFVLTEKKALLLSGDMQHHMTLDTPSCVATLQKEFDRQFNLALPFLFTQKTPEEAMNFYCTITASLNGSSKVLESQPCIYSLLDSQELFLRTFGDNTRPSSLLEMSRKLSEKRDSTFQDFFTADGIRDFARTGSLSGPYGCLPVTFSPQERRRMLLHFLKDPFSSGNYTMLRSGSLCLPRAYCEVFSDYTVFLCLLESQDTFISFHIKEVSIGQAFWDYLSSLDDLSIACSPKETEEFVRSLLNELEQTC